MIIRELGYSDYDKGFCQLLNQLSVCKLDLEQFKKIMHLRSFFHWQSIYTFVAEDEGKLIGTATLFLEQKFSHKGSKVGHIEDVVVDSTSRKKGIGKALVSHLIALAKENGAYKCILDCSEENVPFYEKCGMVRRGTYMSAWFGEKQ